jgi:hypothetical protein
MSSPVIGGIFCSTLKVGRSGGLYEMQASFCADQDYSSAYLSQHIYKVRSGHSRRDMRMRAIGCVRCCGMSR